MLLGSSLSRRVNIVSKDLVALLNQIDGHGEAHVAETDEADPGERKFQFSG